MTTFEILKIEDKFVLSDGRCLIMPDFPMLEGLSTPVALLGTVTSYGGKSNICTLNLEVTHFNIPGCTDLNRLWRLTPRLSDISPDAISIGDTLSIFDSDAASKLLSKECPVVDGDIED